MKMSTIGMLTAGLMVTAVLCPRTYASNSNDFQIWNTDSQELKLNKSFKAVMEEEFRFNNNVSQLYYQHYDGSLIYAINKYVNCGAGYRQIFEQFRNTRNKSVNEPYVVSTVFWEFAGWKFSDRNRFDFRHFRYGRTDSWRYRNLLKMEFPWKFTPLEFQPYVSDELFFTTIGQSFHENRFLAGFGFKITKEIKSEVYYMLRSTRSGGTWVRANILGTKFKISF